MPANTRGAIEDAVSQAVVRFEKEYMGRGPLEARAFLVDDLVVVRLRNVLTPAEHKLVGSPDPARGRDLIKQVRQQLIESGAPLLYSAVQEIVGVPVRSMHTDVSTRTGERVIVFTLEGRPAVAGS
ncbi:MAG: hypothetical protein C0501_23445 [Isosphaera sp.]|nr:hypothetical protein [Isosphaera sp.]